MNSTQDVSSTNQSPIKNKERNSCSTGVSEDSNQIQDTINSLQFEFENSNSLGISYFQPQILQPEINLKLHKKAIQVLFNLCWDRDIPQDCLWTALMIFYSYKAKCIIKKVELQKIVLVCILLSCKVLQPEKLLVKDIIKITNGKYSTKQISQTEQEILEALDFNLYIDNNILSATTTYHLSEFELDQFCCLTEMLMTKNSDVFWKKSVLKSLIKLIRTNSDENINETRAELVGISKSKQGELILRKYSSKIDTQKLLQKWNKY